MSFCVHSQRVQQVQQVQGFQAHHELQQVPQNHGLPELRPLPVWLNRNTVSLGLCQV